ncbi:MAG: hypothetical protein M3237_20815 [Actinomycetota bacterium]|nr:hypothetical protein [Actinomycetota bacterium]
MSLGRALVIGAIAGVVASVAMAIYAMLAAYTKDTGFFTPLYHIASLWASQDTMMASMQDGMGGKDFHFEFGPALLGAVIHMVTGAMYGVIFALAVARLPLARALLVLAGVLWGALVFVISAFIGLPVAAAVFDSGDQITDMAEMAGWGTFFIEHLIYGLVLGVLLAISRRPTPTASHNG